MKNQYIILIQHLLISRINGVYCYLGYGKGILLMRDFILKHKIDLGLFVPHKS